MGLPEYTDDMGLMNSTKAVKYISRTTILPILTVPGFRHQVIASTSRPFVFVPVGSIFKSRLCCRGSASIPPRETIIFHFISLKLQQYLS
jgi:hypothetical protein